MADKWGLLYVQMIREQNKIDLKNKIALKWQR